ncbi:hypothetical protein BKI52_44935 [marine bacterium AO1-C]|nr:hypothetical protein BKI52_44935 [marine bacterium AO1-C]
MSFFKLQGHWNYCLIIIAIAFQLYGVQCRPGITYDSKQYLSSAHSFSKNRQLLNEKGIPHLAHTPLYAVTLSLLGANRLQWSKYLNTICLTITLLVFIYLGNQVLQNSAFQWLFAIGLVTATPLQLIHHFIWSEPLFVSFLAVLLILFHRFLKNANPRLFWGMMLPGFLMCLQRNPGIFILLGVALGLYWFAKVNPWKVIVFTLISTSGWIAWTIYTFQTNQQEIQPAFHNVLGELLMRHNLDHHLNVLSSWFMPLTISLTIRSVLVIASSVLLTVLAVYWRIQLSKFIKTLLIISFVYIICLQFTERVDYHETTRYLAIVFPLVFLVIFQLVELLTKHFSNNISQAFKIMLLLWLLYPIGRTWKNVTFWHQIRCKENLLKMDISYYKPEAFELKN